MSKSSSYQYPYDRDRTIAYIKEHLQANGKLVFVVKHRVASGATRYVKVFGTNYTDITPAVAFVLGYKYNPVKYMKIVGGGMDMLWYTAHTLNIIIPEVNAEDYRSL